MTRLRSGSAASTQRPSSRQIREEKHQKAALCLLGAVSGVATVLSQLAPHLKKRPMHTSALRGQDWIQELLEGDFKPASLYHKMTQIALFNLFRTSSSFSANDGNASLCISSAIART
jgi:hypothetical protein